MAQDILRKRAQQLRKHATPEEKSLWYQYLRDYPIQWYRQKVIGSYIVDFYCSKAKLVIELDGAQHFQDNAPEYDRERTAYLNGAGIEVIRFTNADVTRRFRYVCQAVDEAVQRRL